MIYYLYDKERGDNVKNIYVKMPIKGKVTSLSEVNDYLFSKKMMVKGLPLFQKMILYAPVSGVCSIVRYKTCHSYLKQKKALKC